VAFAGQPLIFKGETLGVLAVFSPATIRQDQFEWLRTFADQAAVALANARAFEEVARLRQQLELERDHLREEVREALAFGDIVGESQALRAVMRQVARVAPTNASVLLLGESGTGKELVASAIHDRSSRRHRAFVRVNCASVHADLFESEFFGHIKGAFTGAVRDRVGRFQLADGGTLFMDEVGEIPPMLQAKLLRVLQEGQFERVGEERTRLVDVPNHRGHQSRPGARGGRRAVPRGSVLRSEPVPHRAASASRAQGRPPSAGRALPAAGEPAADAPDARIDGGGPRKAPALRLAG